ncbi:MAG: hypothetical protein V4543_00715 [Bacteroidota bacterium]
MKEKGALDAIPVYHEFAVQAGERITIDARDTIYFLVGSPAHVQIESEGGLYNIGDEYTHEHSGTFEVYNSDSNPTRVAFVKAIIRYPQPIRS